MKHLLVLSVFLFVFSCGKCPECFNISDPIRIIYLDEKGENLLSNGDVKPSKVTLQNSGDDIAFGIKDFVVKGSTEKYHIEFANEEIHEACLDKQCTIIIEFEGMVIADTLRYSIKEEKSDCCTSYSVGEFKYNNQDYQNQQENTIGAFEVMK